MLLKNSWYRAIECRTSRRAYKYQRIEPDKTEQIISLTDTINQESGLNIQFVENGDLFLSGFKASYGLISGKPSMIALVGNKADPELKQKVGYYGEFLLLECVSLGLGTCWIGGSYNKKECLKHIQIREDDDLVCVIAVGNAAENKSLREVLISQIGKGKQSFDELLTEKDCTPPLWVKSGIESARIAPSSANGKPIGYRYVNDQLSVFIAKKNHDAEEIDLGISMAHFQLGAMSGLKDGSWVKKDSGYLFQ